MNEMLLIAAIAGQTVALRTETIQSVIELEVLTPIPCAPPHVAGLSTLRSRVLTVIDPQASLGLGASALRQAEVMTAVVAVHDGHAYALLIDRVEDVCQARSAPAPLHAPLHAHWSAMARGLVETDHGPLLLVDIAALIAGPDEARAA